MKVVLRKTFVGFVAIVFAALAWTCKNGASQEETIKVSPTEKVNPQVVNAQKRCVMEIKKSALQPANKLSGIQIKACLYAIQDKISGCYKGHDRTITVKLTISKDGAVQTAFAVGDTSDYPEALCVLDFVKKVTFPKVKTEAAQLIKYPFKVAK